MTDSPLIDELISLEQRLHRSSDRQDTPFASTLLAEEFCEFGSSGRVYDKASILKLMAEETPGAPIEATDYRLTYVAEGAVLLTYRARRGEALTLRSSLWIWRDARWQMLFHQGTVAT